MKDWMTGIDETYPDGRYIYFEGYSEEVEEFIKAVESVGGYVHMNITAEIPSGKVEEWYRLSDAKSIAWGT